MTDTTTPETYPYEKRYWYPHMQPDHVALWERFIERYPDMFESCWYDLPVGTIPEFNDPAHPVYVGGQEKLYRKKIDVVGFSKGKVVIIEIKPKATASAIGQVKRYKYLFTKEWPQLPTSEAAVITDTI